MMSIKKLVASICLTISFCATAHAGSISFGNTIVTNPDKFEGFDRPGPISIVATNEFSANGLTFQAISGNSGPTANINSSCNVGGLTGSAWLMIGVRPSCGVDSEINIVDMIFDSNVTELSFLFRTNNNAGYLFESFLGQTQQAQLNVSSQIVGNTTQFLFTGEFNRIRFSETNNASWFWVDDMRWKTSQLVVNQVPAPASLALALLGFGFIVSMRKNTKDQ